MPSRWPLRILVSLLAYAGLVSGVAGGTVEFCNSYADAAMNDLRIQADNGCEPQGGFVGRYSRSRADHFNFCRSEPDDAFVEKERWKRAATAAECKSCKDYADAATNDVRLASGCTMPGPPGRWSDNHAAHQKFCLNEKDKGFVHKEFTARVEGVAKCNACKDYAAAALNDIQIAQTNACILPNIGRYHPSRRAHTDFCMGDPDQGFIDKERGLRAAQAAKCKSCNDYANAATNDVRILKDNGCLDPGAPNRVGFGLTGPPGRWFADHSAHQQFCLNEKDSGFVHREFTIRASTAARCSSCVGYAIKAASFTDQNRNKNCGFRGPLWGNQDLYGHLEQCMGSGDHPSASNDIRASWMPHCANAQKQEFCDRYARTAIAQRGAYGYSGPLSSCGRDKNSARWIPDATAHYMYCIGAPYENVNFEEQARTNRLTECRFTWPPNPAQETPTLVNRFCSQNVKLTIQCQSNPPAYSNGCGLTTEEAFTIAEASFPAKLCVAEDEPAGCCSYEKEEFPNPCACAPEVRYRQAKQSSAPRLLPPPQVLLKLPPSLAPPPGVGTCRHGMVPKAGGGCDCPGGSVFRGGSCVRDTVTTQCPPNRPVGTYPNCCPQGTHVGQGGGCVQGRAAPPCRPGMVPKAGGGCDCPQGTHFANGACVQGSAAPSCRPGMVAKAGGGCDCPQGTHFANGVCVQGRAAPSCRPGMVPKAGGGCDCPPGTVFRYNTCVPNSAKPPPPTVHTPPTAMPRQPTCTPGAPKSRGGCGCPAGTYTAYGRCIPYNRAAPPTKAPQPVKTTQPPSVQTKQPSAAWRRHMQRQKARQNAQRSLVK